MADGMIDRLPLATFRPGHRPVTAMNRREPLALLVGQAGLPFLAKRLPVERRTLLFAGFGPEFGLAVRVGDAQRLRLLLDQGGPPRKALQHIARNPRDLE